MMHEALTMAQPVKPEEDDQTEASFNWV